VLLEGLGIVHDEVEDALIVEVAAGAGGFFAGVAAAEEALEGQTRIAFRSKRHGFILPCEIELVGAAVAAVAVAGAADFIAAQFEGGQAGDLTDGIGGDLVDGDTDADVGSGGFAGLDAREEGGVGAGVVAGSVAICAGLVVGETGEDGDVLIHLGERGEGA
jgi:hypothetical protein